jgi:hypothetical protein
MIFENGFKTKILPVGRIWPEAAALAGWRLDSLAGPKQLRRPATGPNPTASATGSTHAHSTARVWAQRRHALVCGHRATRPPDGALIDGPLVTERRCSSWRGHLCRKAHSPCKETVVEAHRRRPVARGVSVAAAGGGTVSKQGTRSSFDKPNSFMELSCYSSSRKMATRGSR